MSEHTEQVSLTEWAEWQGNITPELKLYYAIPMGGERTRAAGRRMKDEGAKAGIPDTHLPVARKGYHSLYVELKEPGRWLSEKQKWWFDRLTEQGNLCLVAFGCEDAIQAYCDYLGIEK